MIKMRKLLVFDNYDSFTYNLVHCIREIGFSNVDVYRNDEIALEEIDKYDLILLSPGPGLPEESGILKELIRTYSKTKKIMGVCLGHQAIGEVFGADLINLDKVYHGVSTYVNILDSSELLFKELPARFKIGRYHSWVVDKKHFPECLKITAVDEEGQIMALRHRDYDVCGVQFHPESILTDYGKEIINNWLNYWSL